MIRTYNRVLLSKAALFKLDSLANLLIKHDGHCWEIGDLVNQLLKNHRVPLSIISSKVRYSKSHLSELASTARLFPPHARTSNFQDSLLARRIFVRFSGLHMSPEEIRDCIAKMQGKRPRAVKAFFLGLMIQKATHCTLQELQFVGKQNDALCNRCIHDDYRNVIPQLPDNSVKIFNADPPFADYSWGVDGGYKSSRAESSGLRFDTDSNTHAQALEITLALFDLCLSKLKNGGCLLLWQPGAKPDSRIILTKAAESGWDVAVALTWLKSNTGISAKDYPYVPTSERLLVFVPKDMSLLKHEYEMNPSDVLIYPSETIQASRDIRTGKIIPQSVHMFQKPLSLMNHLVRKHSYPGELIVDCFGCSGSCCIAANSLGRRWLYIESNKNNFLWGAQRIMSSIKEYTASHLVG